MAGDTDVEADEAFALVLTDPVGLVLARDRATAIIANDDPQQAQSSPALAVTDASVAEGDAGVRLRSSPWPWRPRPPTVTLTYATEDATAVAGEDYQASAAA